MLYRVYVGLYFYPKGGIEDYFCEIDYAGSIEDLKDLQELFDDDEDFDWCQIVEDHTHKLVLKGTKQSKYTETERIDTWEWETNE